MNCKEVGMADLRNVLRKMTEWIDDSRSRSDFSANFSMEWQYCCIRWKALQAGL